MLEFLATARPWCGEFGAVGETVQGSEAQGGVSGAKSSTGKRQSKLSVCLGLGFRVYRV